MSDAETFDPELVELGVVKSEAEIGNPVLEQIIIASLVGDKTGPEWTSTSTEANPYAPGTTDVTDVSDRVAEECNVQIDVIEFGRTTSSETRVILAKKIAASGNVEAITAACESSVVRSKEEGILVQALIDLKACEALAEVYFYLDPESYLATSAAKVIAREGTEAVIKKALDSSDESEGRDILKQALMEARERKVTA